MNNTKALSPFPKTPTLLSFPLEPWTIPRPQQSGLFLRLIALAPWTTRRPCDLRLFPLVPWTTPRPSCICPFPQTSDLFLTVFPLAPWGSQTYDFFLKPQTKSNSGQVIYDLWSSVQINNSFITGQHSESLEGEWQSTNQIRINTNSKYCKYSCICTSLEI